MCMILCWVLFSLPKGFIIQSFAIERVFNEVNIYTNLYIVLKDEMVKRAVIQQT